jgi:hypothetical protein
VSGLVGTGAAREDLGAELLRQAEVVAVRFQSSRETKLTHVCNALVFLTVLYALSYESARIALGHGVEAREMSVPDYHIGVTHQSC